MPLRRLHILFLIPTLTGGGAERVIVALLNHLDRAKFRLTLCVLDTANAAFLDDLPADVSFLDLRHRRCGTPYQNSFGSFGGSGRMWSSQPWAISISLWPSSIPSCRRAPGILQGKHG